MTKTTKRIMRNLRRKLTIWEGMSLSACGDCGAVRDACEYRIRLEDELELAVEHLARKAGEV